MKRKARKMKAWTGWCVVDKESGTHESISATPLFWVACARHRVMPGTRIARVIVREAPRKARRRRSKM